MPMRWVVHDNGFRNLIANAANLDLAAPGVKNIFHPPTISPVRDSNQKSIGHSKNIYRRTVEPARFSASRRDYTESRQSSGEPDREPVCEGAMKSCYLPFAEPNQKDRNR
jgi:hypothetical protein